MPVFLKRAVARVVHYELVEEDTNSELIESRAKAALKTLDAVAAGELRIGEGDDDQDGLVNPRTRQGKVLLEQPGGRAYRRRDLRGLV